MLKMRRAKEFIFVCISNSSDGIGFVSKEVRAVSRGDASVKFLEQTKLNSKTIYGPFRRRFQKEVKNKQNLQFSSISKRTIYNDWEVNALFLKEPEDHAYLVFIKRVDGKNASIPKGNVIVPISELQ